MFQFPQHLYTDVRMEETTSSSLYINNGEKLTDSSNCVSSAIIRVYDGTMWYTSVVNDFAQIQREIDALALVATRNEHIEDDPVVRMFEVHQDDVTCFAGDRCFKSVSHEQKEALLSHYIDTCVDPTITCIRRWSISYYDSYTKKQFYSSKGASILQDKQSAWTGMSFDVEHNGITTTGGKGDAKLFFDELFGLEDKIIKERDRTIDFAMNAISAVPGDYPLVLSPIVTAMFTHESFGHKSESDFMLNDKTLQDEWVLGKKVGSDLVTIVDDGSLKNNGFAPYDDEGTKSRKTTLIQNGTLTARLHDANSASILKEELTGNSRAQNASFTPIVRMTNTYMVGGHTSLSDMISDIKDGIYVHGVNYGTGNATFTLQPNICYKIENGQITTPLRVNVITGSVFQALYDIEALGDDFELFDTFTCGKNGQSMPVSAGGPTIRVKSLTVN